MKKYDFENEGRGQGDRNGTCAIEAETFDSI